MKRHILLAFAGAFVLMSSAFTLVPAAPAEAQQTIKLAYVDLQRALNEVEDGKAAKSKLKKQFESKQKTLDGKQEELKKYKDSLEQQLKGDVLSEEKKREMMLDYQKRFFELQNTYGTLQKELAESEAKETKKIFDKMAKILKDIGLKEGYTVILEKTESSILWAPQSLDITDQLIQRYNSGG